MAEETDSIYVPSDSELGRFLHESAKTSKRFRVESDGKVFSLTIHEEQSRDDDVESADEVRRAIDATLAATGSWQGNPVTIERKPVPTPEEVEETRAVIKRVAGSWKDVDADAFKEYIRKRRLTANRLPIEW